ncbi:MAG: hypothetical protein M1826_000574 [Phylliscum demangeonii]|nr:MAG: hypothetical protein M1826_000574 [Phylliscum demangeonii]
MSDAHDVVSPQQDGDRRCHHPAFQDGLKSLQMEHLLQARVAALEAEVASGRIERATLNGYMQQHLKQHQRYQVTPSNRKEILHLVEKSHRLQRQNNGLQAKLSESRASERRLLETVNSIWHASLQLLRLGFTPERNGSAIGSQATDSLIDRLDEIDEDLLPGFSSSIATESTARSNNDSSDLLLDLQTESSSENELPHPLQGESPEDPEREPLPYVKRFISHGEAQRTSQPVSVESVREESALAREPLIETGEFFKYGIRYNLDDIQRTVIISQLPSGITLDSLLSHIRGGQIYSAVILDTRSLTGSMTSLIIFVDPNSAANFVRYCQQNEQQLHVIETLEHDAVAATLRIRFSSIVSAVEAYTLIRETGRYRKLKTSFTPDPCAAPFDDPIRISPTTS